MGRRSAGEVGPAAIAGRTMPTTRRRLTTSAPPTSITDSLAFVGGAYGILLGLLLVFAVGHFVDTRQAAREEAISAVALFNSVEPYPAEQRDRVRHDLICLMRSSATDDWAASTASDFSPGSENTNAYAVAVQRQLEALPQESAVEASNHYFVTTPTWRWPRPASCVCSMRHRRSRRPYGW